MGDWVVADHEHRITELEDKVKIVEKNIDQMQEDLSRNRGLIQEIKSDTSEIVGVFRASQGFIKVLNFFGTVLKWVAVTGAALGALWAYLHGHNIK